jgi:Membrane dipeptidase (Peptidase family M19)
MLCTAADKTGYRTTYYTNQYVDTIAACGDESLRTGLRFMPANTGFGPLETEALRTRDLGWVIDDQPNYVRPSSAQPNDICGMRNARGLQSLGNVALRQMMRLGMMIDLDHMSRRMVNDVLALAELPELTYPVNSGHNGLADTRCFQNDRFADDAHSCSEHARTLDEYQRLHRLGGMIGMGHGGSPRAFADGYHALLAAVGGRGVAIGTDVNGLFPMPGPGPVDYDSRFPRYWFGREWDYSRDGFAHYGMFPDFIRAATQDPAAQLTPNDVDSFMSSAEDFAAMWEKSEERARAIGTIEQSIVISPQATGGFCPYGLVRGDAEYGGHGPRVTGTITLGITPQRDGILASVNLRLTETSSDWTEVRAQFDRSVYRAPAGTRILRIESPQVTNVDFTLNGGGRNELFQGCDGDEHNIALGATGPAKTIRMVGDTGGADVSGDNNCNCDTRISDITWNPVTLRTTR